MELIYAALLLHSAGKDVTEESVQGVLDGAGVDADAAEVKALIAALEDVDIEEAIETPAATAAPAAAPAASEAPEEEADAEEEPEAEEDEGASEEEAAEGLGSLF